MTGTIHIAVALVSFACVVAGMFTLTSTFMRQARWRPHAAWLMLFPTAALSLLFGQAEGPWVGLMQRLLVAAISAWLILVALRTRSIVSPAEPVTASAAGQRVGR